MIFLDDILQLSQYFSALAILFLTIPYMYLIHYWLSEIPNFNSLYLKPSHQTLLKALDRSRKTPCTSRKRLHSKLEYIWWVLDTRLLQIKEIQESYFFSPAWHGLGDLWSLKRYDVLNINFPNILSKIRNREIRL